MTIKSGLVIRPRWIELILQDKKTWEMRSQPTRVRGRIGLIRQGSGLVVGTATLVDSRPALTRDDYMRYGDKHAIPESMLDDVMAKPWVFPWVLSDVRRLPKPVPYRHKSGAVIFVTLEPSVVAAIAVQDSGAASPEAGGSMPGPRTSSDILPSPDADPVFVFRPERAQAYGRPLEGGEFVVLAGSTAMRHGSPSVKRDMYERDRLVREGVLVADADPSRYLFTRDCTFTSSSRAAGVIKDGNASGPSIWKNKTTGRTLKDHLSPS